MESHQLSFRKSSSEPLAKIEDQRLRVLPAMKKGLCGEKPRETGVLELLRRKPHLENHMPRRDEPGTE